MDEPIVAEHDTELRPFSSVDEPLEEFGAPAGVAPDAGRPAESTSVDFGAFSRAALGAIRANRRLDGLPPGARGGP
eukprot:10715943-Lingulodinium_polyedra.AAC.1